MFCEFSFSFTKTLSKQANQKSKKLSCKPFSRQTRNGLSLFSGCREDSCLLLFHLFFLFSLSKCTFSPQERKVSRNKQNMSFLCENHFQPANPESLTSLKSPIRSLVVIVPKLKSLFSSFENLRGIVRPQKLSEVKSLSRPQSLSMSKKRTVPQRFFNTNLSLFSFSTMPANDRGYGHGRFAGVFAVAQRQSECGRKTR